MSVQSQGGGLMIYLLEDEEGIRNFVIYALGRSGIEAEGFGAPSELYAAMEEKLPRLLLLDRMLPEEDGISVLSFSLGEVVGLGLGTFGEELTCACNERMCCLNEVSVLLRSSRVLTAVIEIDVCSAVDEANHSSENVGSHGDINDYSENVILLEVLAEILSREVDSLSSCHKIFLSYTVTVGISVGHSENPFFI